MRYIALAIDYDGTMAANGQVQPNTLEALKRVKDSGRRLILVTGRHLLDLQRVFSALQIFDYVVAENGSLLCEPASGEERILCDPPPEAFLSLLRSLRVPFATGRSIVSTWVPHHTAVLEAIHRLALDLQVIFNKGAVMILPSGINKAFGLQSALASLQLSLHNTVGIGDGENDHAFISACECGIAVANAVDTLKDRADVRAAGANGAGLVGIIQQLLEDDLARYDSSLTRHSITLGTLHDNPEQRITISSHRKSILVAGLSGSGKSTAVAGILEQLTERKYQFCLVDPEGDYDHFAGTLSLGTAAEIPSLEIVMKALEAPERSIIVNLLALPIAERPAFFAALLPRLLECRAKTARPHWIVIDEAHHLLPTSWSAASSTLPQCFDSTILITVHPEHVAPAALRFVDTAIATGSTASDVLASLAGVIGIDPPPPVDKQPESGQALVWFTGPRRRPILVKTHTAKAERRRHRRNYAEGELSDDHSFYFRGPESKLRLRAHNLVTFLQLAEGVDDGTWLFHLRNNDYSRWFENMIKDPDLAKAAASIEENSALSAEDSRKKIREAVESRYTRAA